MNKPSRREQGGNFPPIDPEILEKLVENQTRELTVRQQELVLQQQQSANAHEYAQLALQAQAKDREQARVHYQKFRRERLWFAIFISTLLAGFLVYALNTGKDAIAMEVLKAMIYLLAGGLGGYAIKGQINNKNSDSPNYPSPTGGVKQGH